MIICQDINLGDTDTTTGAVELDSAFGSPAVAMLGFAIGSVGWLCYINAETTTVASGDGGGTVAGGNYNT